MPSTETAGRSKGVWPALPLGAWRDTYATLHMWTQIVGKTRLALAPMENHWWQVTLYVTSRGLTTSPMPSRGVTISVDADLLDHRPHIATSEGASRTLPLVQQSVADFYAAYVEALRALGHAVRIRPVPVEVERAIPFADDREHQPALLSSSPATHRSRAAAPRRAPRPFCDRRHRQRPRGEG